MYEKRKEYRSGCLPSYSTNRRGKTVSSLMFALEHAVKNGMDRIIYVAPFTTIIEQNAQVIRELAGDQNVLEHHASFDFSASEELRNLQLASEN